MATKLDILRKAAMILDQTSSDAWVRLRQSPAFWDVDVRTLDPNRHAVWIIDRILQFGQWDEWIALFHLYDSRTIRDAVNHRRVPHHVRQFWQSYFMEEGAPVIKPETLHPAIAALWHQLGSDLCPRGYLLCGGTALALYLGHRQSEDLDFMTATPNDPQVIVSHVQSLNVSMEVIDRSAFSIHLRLNSVKVSYLWQPGIQLETGSLLEGIPLASLASLAALKCNAIANRGSRKDFVDLYALLQMGWSLTQLLDVATHYAPQLNRAHLLRSLTYFQDAEQEPELQLTRKWCWEDVRLTFERSVHHYLHQQLPSPKPKDPQP